MITPSQLLDIQREIEGYSHEMGFDFFPVVYEMVDYHTMSEVAAYGGFPTRYPHWSFGMEYDRLAKGYGYGLSKIYEMVVNTDPVYAYLLDVNQVIDQKMVIAHVCGHAHFFKHNYMFGPTNRKMMDEMANHGNRIRRYMAKYGVETVENFIDCCLTIEDLIDMHAPFIKRASTHEPVHAAHEDDEGETHPSRINFRPAATCAITSIRRVSSRSSASACEPRRWHRRSFRRSRRRCFALLVELRAAATVAKRCAVHHPRRGVLLCATGPNQNHERGLRLLGAHATHDAESFAARRRGRLR
jgi:hypothetical protein